MVPWSEISPEMPGNLSAWHMMTQRKKKCYHCSRQGRDMFALQPDHAFAFLTMNQAFKSRRFIVEVQGIL